MLQTSSMNKFKCSCKNIYIYEASLTLSHLSFFLLHLIRYLTLLHKPNPLPFPGFLCCFPLHVCPLHCPPPFLILPALWAHIEIHLLQEPSCSTYRPRWPMVFGPFGWNLIVYGPVTSLRQCSANAGVWKNRMEGLNRLLGSIPAFVIQQIWAGDKKLPF